MYINREFISQLHRTSVTQGLLAGILMCNSGASKWCSLITHKNSLGMYFQLNCTRICYTSLVSELFVYHPFQNHYTHKIIIFKLFRTLQLQFSGPTGINYRYSYSFVGLTGICLYSYSSVQLH